MDLKEAINHPSWTINDSIDMLRHHALKLVDLGAMSETDAATIVALLPCHRETPVLD